MLTVALITVIFYFHPSTTTATLFYRTVPIIPEATGRVSEVNVEFSAPVKKGDVIFKLDSSKQEAAMETARRKIAEVDASMLAAQADVLKAEGQIQQAQGDYQQASDELNVKRELQQRNPGMVPQRDIEKLQVLLTGRQGALDSANASKQSATVRVTALLPAEKASAEAALAEAQVDLNKTTIRAGVDGRVEQFGLRVGDIVNPMVRSAGVLIPSNAGRTLSAGFGQIEAQVMKIGMVAEATCVSKPWAIIPMVVTRCAGLHRRGPVPGRRTTGRGAADAGSRHHSDVPGADLSRRPGWRHAREQLRRQRLHQQPRSDRRKGNRVVQAFCVACCGRGRCRARDVAAHPGPASPR
jgi:multidrug resistance efflux pump